MHATPLVPGALGAHASRPGIDPMLVWADATGLALLGRPGQPAPTHWPLVVDEPGPGLPACRGTSWPTARLKAWLQAQAGDDPALPSRLRLALPVLPLRPRPQSPRPAGPGVDWPQARGPVLLGVIDHGCPFAHALLRRGRTGTRVLALWDQDDSSAGIAHHAAGTPHQPGYGTLLTRAQLEALMTEHTVPGLDLVDEGRCYEALGYDALRHGFTHGSAVMGVLVDRAAPGSRLGSSAGSRSRPGPAPEPVHAADLVFVQIPRDSVQDCSSAALERYVLDGLDAIIACRGDATQLIVTLSDGTSRTLHDGLSLVETGIAERAARLQTLGVTLEVLVAAGNSRDEQRHAQFDALAAGQPGQVAMQVLPDDEAATFVTLRLPALGAGLRVTLTAPDGRRLVARVGEAATLPAAAQAGSPVVAALVLAAPPAGAAAAEAAQGLIALHPTRRGLGGAGMAAAPAGRWRISVVADAELSEPVHLWISRSQTNATALPRGHQARFVDEDGRYDPARHRLPLQADPLPPASPIRRQGSVNGLANRFAAEGLRVVGASYQREGSATLHSASGPSAGPAGQARPGPDLAMPVDFARTHPGLNVPGSRSGLRLRVSGSSFAAPQAAALRANGEALPTLARPDEPGRRLRTNRPDAVVGLGIRQRR